MAQRRKLIEYERKENRMSILFLSISSFLTTAFQAARLYAKKERHLGAIQSFDLQIMCIHMNALYS